MPLSIDEIPTASGLQQQLDTINRAIAALQAGSTITNLTISAPPPVDQSSPFTMPVAVILQPPIDDPTTVGSLITALEGQAGTITVQLVDMGYAAPA